jgi:hypothetical protein
MILLSLEFFRQYWSEWSWVSQTQGDISEGCQLNGRQIMTDMADKAQTHISIGDVHTEGNRIKGECVCEIAIST